jgi:putative flippase GtrA
MLRALSAARRSAGTRFAVVGAAMTVLHLAVFTAASTRVPVEAANVVAFLLVTQVNFVVSYRWTWASRRVPGREPVRAVVRRAVVFNGSAALTFGVNAAVLSLAYRVAGATPLVSAVVATVVSAGASFLMSSRVVFARRPSAGLLPAQLLPPPVAVPRLSPGPPGRGCS